MESNRLEKGLLDILRMIRDFEIKNPEDGIGYEFDYLQDRVGTQSVTVGAYCPEIAGVCCP